MTLPEKIAAALGAIYAVCTALAVALPVGSKLGALCATIAADLKGHTAPVGK